jgi:hypothetical protein
VRAWRSAYLREQWGRLLLAGLGVIFLLYGAVLAWHPQDATTVLAVGAVFFLVALVLPADWSNLTFALPGGPSVKIERAANSAQGQLAALPAAERQQLAPPADEAEPQAEQPQETEATPTVGVEADVDERRTAYARAHYRRPAFASHESLGRDWLRLRLVRHIPPTLEPGAVTCAVRKPGDADFRVSVPRLVGPTSPPSLLGVTLNRPGVWLEYEATFPDFFFAREDELPNGQYVAIWGIVPQVGGRAHVLASDVFAWPPTFSD